MTIRCVAIDDEPLALTILEDYVKQTPFLEMKEKFTNPIKAFEYLSNHEVDLVFLDIQMPDLSGLDIVAKLQNKPMLIYTTAFSEYAIEGFKTDAVDYLLKPIDYPDFLKAAIKVKERFAFKNEKLGKNKVKKDFLFVKSEYRIVRINFGDIIYIQSMSEYVRIVVANGKPIMTLLSLKTLENLLPESVFMRVHRSFIVNLDKIKVIERQEIHCDDGIVIPISHQYLSKVQEFLNLNLYGNG